jgi:uncharacterized membrane protein YeaQ/YmgE (transglycosylase-associated protein family)
MWIMWTVPIGFIDGLPARAFAPGKQAMAIALAAVLSIAGSLLGTCSGQAMGWYAASAGPDLIASGAGPIVVLVLHGVVVRNRA